MVDISNIWLKNHALTTLPKNRNTYTPAPSSPWSPLNNLIIVHVICVVFPSLSESFLRQIINLLCAHM